MLPASGRKGTILSVALYAGALVLAGCAHNPATGGWDFSLVQQQRLEQASYKAAQRFASYHGIVEDRALVSYVQGIGDRLKVSSHEPERSFRFRILDVQEPNAVSFADGSIFLTRGMLALINSEDELASVLGHEIAHVTARHVRSQVSRRSLLRGVASLVLTPLLAASEGGFGDALTTIVQPAFSRDQEREADFLGMEYATSAAFEVRCGARVLLSLDRVRELSKEDGETGFLATHPAPAERYELLTQAWGAAPGLACRSGYLERIEGLRVGEPRGDVYVHEEQGIVLPRVSARIRPDREYGELVATSNHRGTFLVVADPRIVVRVKRFPAGKGIEDAMQDAARTQQNAGSTAEPEEIVTGGRPGVRLVLSYRGQRGAQLQHSHWLMDGQRLYLLEATVAEGEWERAAPYLLRLTDRFEAVEIAGLASVPLVPVVHLHVVRDEDTLQTIEQLYRGWSAAEISVYNALAPDASLPAGTRLKVMRPRPLACVHGRCK